MIKLIKTLMFVLTFPALVFYCVMALPVVFFALPSAFKGNALNAVFVILWVLGGYGIYSGLVAICSFGRNPYHLEKKIQVGIVVGVATFGSMVVFSPSSEIEWFWRCLACLSMLPPTILLFSSISGASTR